MTVTWEAEHAFMGAFKANLPGHYRYQERLYTHFMQDDLPGQTEGCSSPATTCRGRRDGRKGQ